MFMDVIVFRKGSLLDRWIRVIDLDLEFWELDEKIGNNDIYKEEIENVYFYLGI